MHVIICIFYTFSVDAYGESRVKANAKDAHFKLSNEDIEGILVYIKDKRKHKKNNNTSVDTSASMMDLSSMTEDGLSTNLELSAKPKGPRRRKTLDVKKASPVIADVQPVNSKAAAPVKEQSKRRHKKVSTDASSEDAVLWERYDEPNKPPMPTPNTRGSAARTPVSRMKYSNGDPYSSPFDVSSPNNSALYSGLFSKNTPIRCE